MKNQKVIYTAIIILLNILLIPSINADENPPEGPNLIVPWILHGDRIYYVGKDYRIEFGIENIGNENTEYISLKIILYSESGEPLAILSDESYISASSNNRSFNINNSYSDQSVGVNETLLLQLSWDTGLSIKSNGTYKGYNPSKGDYMISINISGGDNDIEQSRNFYLHLREESKNDTWEFIKTLEIIGILVVLIIIVVIIVICYKKKRKT